MKKTLTILFIIHLTACTQTSRKAEPATIGTAPDWAAVEASLDEPGPIEFERIVAADWEVPRSGLINLKREEAAHLDDGPEPIQIYMYALRHPQHGLFLVDTGVDRATAGNDKSAMAASWLVHSGMNIDALDVRIDTRTWTEQQSQPLAGVFLTHLHLDHAMGLPDVPDDVPVYTGPNERKDAKFMYMFSRGTMNRTVGEKSLRELQTRPVKGAPFEGVLDVFGDGTLFALHIPGHTRGSLAFLVRTTEGPVLMTGDGCHTAWGWDHAVEPGTFNTDRKLARQSLLKLLEFAEDHPQIAVHLGHQPHTENAALARR